MYQCRIAFSSLGSHPKVRGGGVSKPAAISAAILAGGTSRRFGSDKALAPSPLDGRPILATIVDCVQSVAADVFVVAPADRPYGTFGVPVMTEPIPGQGPLGGLEMALRVAKHDRCLVVACDLPFLNRDLLTWMTHRPFDADALVPILGTGSDPDGTIADGQAQPLHAIYRGSCLPSVERLLAGEQRRMSRLLQVLRVEYLFEVDVCPFDPTLKSFVNVNSIADLAQGAPIVDGACSSTV